MKNSKNRDISDYQKEYNNHEFEEIMVEYRRRNVIEQMSKYSCNSILEIGCGNQPIAKYFNDFSNMVIVEPGNDFYRSALKLKNNHSDKKIICYNDYVENIIKELKEYSFDFVIISSLLHELDDNLEILKKISLICNKSTVVHINVPNKNSLHRILAYRSGLIPSLHVKSDTQKRLQQNDFFDLESLSRLISDAGFSKIEEGSYFIKPFTHKQMAGLINQKIINKEILDGFYNLSLDLPNFGSEIFVNIRI